MKFYKKILGKLEKSIEVNEKTYLSETEIITSAMNNSTAKLGGKVVPFLIQPMCFNKSDENIFKELCETLNSILNKVTNEYIKNSVFRKQFNFTKELEELILIDPGYNVNIPVARYDIFYRNNREFQFCELNGDGTSGMNESNTLEKILLNSKLIKDLDENLSHYELFESWIDELLDIYEKFDSKNENPNIAIMDWDNVSTIEEFKEFQKAFRKRNINAFICDPRDLKYKNKKLYFNNNPIDLIYRRALTFELLQKKSEVSGLLSAYKDGSVCMIGSFRSQIMHNKQIFSILQNKNNAYLFTKDELEFISKHIPKTSDFDLSNIDNIIRNKDNHVLKPKDSYAAKGVYIGKDFSQTEWSQIVNSIKNSDEYLIQQFIQPEEIECNDVSGNNITKENYKFILGLFVYNGKFSGVYTRAGKENVIASATGCKIMGNLFKNC